ncbi:MAG: cyclic nucleotide-binding domain-containing protein [Sphingobacteriales bacterium]|nr:cyclic nucleotide-binding domain-containing protein [Sphingobacteriales bacterium]
MEPIFFIALSLIVGAAIRHFLQKTPLPYTVLLLIFGIILGLIDRLGWLENMHSLANAVKWAGNIDPHVILFVFLPTLIFEAAFAMDLHIFRKISANAIILAVPGILVAIALTAVLAMVLKAWNVGFGTWGWAVAFMFGSVVSATDPVAVVALLKELGASKKLSTLIEGESLLNDGTAIVFFMVFYTAFTGSAHGASNPALVEFLRVSAGGVAIGLIIAAVTLIWIKKVFNDAMIEISLVIAAAYLTFYIAEHFLHVSGVLGLVGLGLSMASAGRTRISPDVQHFLHEFWELAAFIANTLIFIIVGVVISERSVFHSHDLLILFILYLSIHVTRGIMILLFYPFMRRLGYGLNRNEGIILWYGGLRGAVGLALALVVAGEPKIPEEIRHQFLFYIAGIVTLTLLINATTVKAVVHALGMTKIPPVKALMFSNVFRTIFREIEHEKEVLSKDRFMSNADWNSVKKFYPSQPDIIVTESEIAMINPLNESRRRCLEKEKSSYWNQFKEGLLSAQAYSKLTDNIKEIIDNEGKKPLNERPYLIKLWQTPAVYAKMMKVPLLNNFARQELMERLALRYDIARGFLISQEEVAKMMANMDFDFNQDNVVDEKETEIETTIREEINQNRLKSLNYIKELHEAFPEISKAIETRQASRSLLNFEKKTIQKLLKEGRIEEDEAQRLIINLEKRLKDLMESPMMTRLLSPFEILEQTEWLKGTDAETIEKVKSIAKEKNHLQGEVLMSKGESGESGMVIITSGAVKVIVNDQVVDILGSGRIIGEMSVLTGAPRTAKIVADTPVTALWLESEALQKIIERSSVIEYNLWRMAGIRFAENLLGHILPYQSWSLLKLKRWVNHGEVRKTLKGDVYNLEKHRLVHISGTATDRRNNQIFTSPSIVPSIDLQYESDGWLYISPDITLTETD